jgi:hypothetical protein
MRKFYSINRGHGRGLRPIAADRYQDAGGNVTELELRLIGFCLGVMLAISGRGQADMAMKK